MHGAVEEELYGGGVGDGAPQTAPDRRQGAHMEWRGSGIEEEGICKKTKDVLVKIDPYYFRPTEVDLLHGDPSKAYKEIGWKSKVKFDKLVKIMMEFELDKLQSQ